MKEEEGREDDNDDEDDDAEDAMKVSDSRDRARERT